MSVDKSPNCGSEILFVTAYKDIDRRKWANYSRSTDDYLALFFRLADIIEYPMVVFLEADLLEKLAKYRFKGGITFEPLEKVATFYSEFLSQDAEIMASAEYRAKVPECRRTHPEHLYSEYNLINHSKPCFLREAKKMHPEYAFYSWIDFGFVRNVENIPKNLDLGKVPRDKIIYQTIAAIPSERLDPVSMLASYDVYLTGCAFIVGSALVEIFEDLYRGKIVEMHSKGVTDDDQSFVLQLYYDRPEIFCVYYHPEWCKLYGLLV
jgi:hypothetical protein